MRTLNLPVEDSIADVYNKASASERSRANSAVNLLLSRLFKKDNQNIFSQSMDEISDEALKNGLTIEKLGELMEWDEDTMKNLFGTAYPSNAQ